MKAIPRTVLALSLVAAAAAGIGCSKEQPPALVASAKTFLAKNDVRAAVVQLKSALQLDPDLAEARFLLGRTLLETNEPVLAEVELRKALALHYGDAAVLPLIVDALIQQGQAQRAVSEFGTLEIADRDAAASVKTTLASAYAQLNEPAKAELAINQALQLAPDHPRALLIQAGLKATAKEFDGAFALVDRVLAKNPADHEALQTKGMLLFAVKHDAAGALELENKALALRPDWLPAHETALDILLSNNELIAAKTQLDALRKVWPNRPQTRYFEARLAFQNQDYKTARDITQRLLALDPSNVRVLLLASSIELQAGSVTQADNYASKAITRATDDEFARRLLAQIYLREGDPLRAQKTIGPLLERHDPDADVLQLAGQAAQQSGDTVRAEKYFVRAVALDPHNVPSRTALASMQISKGNKDAGLAQLEEVAASDKGISADFALINARVRQGDFAGALRAADALEKKLPGKPYAAQARGEIELARNGLAAAREHFTKALAIDPLYLQSAVSLASLDLREGKPADAPKRFSRILEADPKNMQVLLAIAELQAKAGAPKEEIVRSLGAAIKAQPTSPTPRLLLIDLYLRSNDPAAALSAAQEGSSTIPGSVSLLTALGRAQIASKDVEQAIATFKKLAGLQRGVPEPDLYLGEAYMARVDYEAARTHLNRALEIAPRYLPAERGLVMLELAEGHADRAMALARRVETERPDEYAGFLMAGDISAVGRDFAGAATAYRAALKRGAGTDVANKLHGVLSAGGKSGDADAFAASWIAEHPQDFVFRSYLGDVALAKSDYAAAEVQYQAVVKAQPENAAALNNLAAVMGAQKKAGAKAYAEKANALAPDQPVFMDTLSQILASGGELPRAIEIQAKAVARDPQRPELRFTLARLYVKAGNKAQARAELETLAKLGSKFARQDEVTELLKTL